MRNAATSLVRTLQEAGFRACFAGGCVRDELLGKAPKDYDIATDARPDQIKTLFPGATGVGAHFGVMLVRRGEHTFEIATFRKDGPYSDGRKPDTVSFATIEEDAARRDFTINGLYFDPIAEKLLDYVEGEKDIKAKIVRAIGEPEARFAEDHLRLLRAIRFATTLDFAIEPRTWEAIRHGAAKISRISPERVRDELNRIWLHPRRVEGFDLLVDSDLMAVILPEILALRGCEQPAQWHPEGDVFTHTRLMLSLLPNEVSLPLVLSVLFHDIAKPATFSFDENEQRIRFNGHDKEGARMTEGILRRLRYSNDTIEATVAAVENHMMFKDVQNMRTAKLKRFMARPTFEDELELHRVDCLGSNGLTDNYTFLLDKREAFSQEPLIPPPLIDGHDLKALGLKPSPVFGEILTRVQNRQLEGELCSRQEALSWVQETLIPELEPE